MSRFNVKLLEKFVETNGVSSTTGKEWRRQEMRFVVIREDGTETNETIVATCKNALLLDAPALKVGATGILSFFLDANEWNGKYYQRVNISNFTPQTFAPNNAENPAEKVENPAQIDATLAASESEQPLPF